MVPNRPSCWICLVEGSDDEDRPLVRDCSCRGDDAGFAHLSCIIKYAEHKSKQSAYNDKSKINTFSNAWVKCPNCNSNYENQLSTDLSTAFVSYAETSFRGNSFLDNLRVLIALQAKINSMTYSLCSNMRDDENRMAECEEAINKLMSAIVRMKKEMMMDRWIHMPPTSTEYIQYRVIRADFEAFGYQALGSLKLLDRTEESRTVAISNYKKALVIYNLLGCEPLSNAIKKEISYLSLGVTKTVVKSGANVEVDVDAKWLPLLKNVRDDYERLLESDGEGAAYTIITGLHYAELLGKANCTIEGEGLATKLVAIARRVHGPDHRQTKSACECLENFKASLPGLAP